MPGRYSLELLELAPQPPAAEAVISSLRTDDVDLVTLATVVEGDLALSARVLRLANSVHYGLPRRVATVSHAIGLLGHDTVRALCASAACATIDAFTDAGPPGFNHHNLLTATAAAEIAERVGYHSGEAFSTGLLHDIGCLFLYRLNDTAFEVSQQGEDMTTILTNEIQAFGMSHPMVGAEALEAWGFPERMVDAVADHHGAFDPVHALGRIVRAAESIAVHLEPSVGHLDDDRLAESLTAVNLSPADLESILAGVTARLVTASQRSGQR